MFLKGFLFIVLIILSAIFLIIAVIFFIIRLADDHPKKWNWLIAVLIALAVLMGSIFLFVRKVVNTAKVYGDKFEKQMEESFNGMQDSLASDFHYKLLDSVSINPTLKQLKAFEEKNGGEKAPNEFYVYLGFRDYYRMPLTFPFSLHCVDVLESASLFNEKYVVDYNTSDNGEIDCHLNDINAFAFDDKGLIAKQVNQDKKEKYIIYEFKNEKSSQFNSEKEAFSAAKKQFNYSGSDTLISVMNYHRLFN